jgi:hypothetical protein
VPHGKQFKTLLIGIFWLLALPSLASTIVDDTPTQFLVGDAAFKGQKREVLSIPNATALEVTISGEINPRGETLRVYQMRRGKTHDAVLYREDSIAGIKPFIVAGNQIVVTLNSTGKTKRQGVRVTITTVSPAVRLQHIRQKTQIHLRRIERQQEGAIFSIIQSSAARLRQLQQSVQNQDNLSPQQKQTISQHFDRLSLDYINISAKKDSVLRKNRIEIQHIKQLSKQINGHIKQGVTRRDNIQADIQRLQKVGDKKDSIAQMRHNIRLKAKQSLHKSLDIQITAWLQFKQAHAALLPVLEQFQAHLGLLFYALSVQAEIYQEAAIIIPHDVGFARETLHGLSELKQALTALNTDWTQLKTLQVTLQEIGF